MKIPLVENITTRDGTTAKDAHLKNALIDSEPNAPMVQKRPGLLQYAATAAQGLGQGLIYAAGRVSQIVNGFLSDVLTGVGFPLLTTGSASMVPVVGSPFALNANSSGGVTVSSSGGFVFVVEATPGTVSVFSLNDATGFLTPVLGSPFYSGGGADDISVSPDNAFVFVSNNSANTISVFSLNQSTGAITQVAGSPFATGAGPLGLQCTPDGKWLFVANSTAATLSVYAINQVTGALTLTGAPYAATASTNGVLITPNELFVFSIALSSAVVQTWAFNSTTGALSAPLSTTLAGIPGALLPSNNSLFLLATINTGTTIAVYAINQTTGALTAVAGSPFPAGTTPYGIAMANDMSFVLVTDTSTNLVQVFYFNPGTGQLIPTGTPITTSASPSGIVLSPDNKYAFLASSGSPQLPVLALQVVLPSGFLTQILGSPFTSGAGPTGITVTPDGAHLISANNSANTLSVFSINQTTGALAALTTAATGGNPNTVFASPNGAFVYATNQTGGSVSAYAFNSVTGTLTPVAGSPFLAGGSPYGGCVSTTGAFVFTAGYASDNLAVFSVNPITGVLTQVPGSPFATALGPFAVSVSPNGNFVYVANTTSNSISVFALNSTTGFLTPVAGSPFAAGIPVIALASSPNGQYLFAAGSSSNNVAVFGVNSATGYLTQVASSPFATGNSPISIGVSPNGAFVFTANQTDNTITVFSLNSATGYLTPVQGSPFAALTKPYGFAVSPNGAFAFVADYATNTVASYQVHGTVTGLLSTLSGEINSTALVKSANNLWLYQNNAATLVTSSYPLVQTVPGIVTIDTTTYVMDTNANILGSNLGDPTTWNALNTIQANTQQDNPVALARHLNYLVAFKDQSTEFFYDAGNPSPGSPLSPILNAYVEVGCAAAASIQNINDLTLFMSKTSQRGRGVSLITGLAVQRVSTTAVDKILNADSLATVYSFAVAIAGHNLYVLTLKSSNVTLYYDLETQIWGQLTSCISQVPILVSTLVQVNNMAVATVANHGLQDGDPATVAGATPAAYNGTFSITYIDANTFSYPVPSGTATPATGTISLTKYVETYFRGVNYMGDSGIDLIQDELTGAIYQFSTTQYQDNGAPINVTIRTNNLSGETSSLTRVSALEVIGDKVVGNAHIRYTDNDYQTFSTYRPVDLNANRSQIVRCGASRRRAFEIRHIDNSALRLESLLSDAKP